MHAAATETVDTASTAPKFAASATATQMAVAIDTSLCAHEFQKLLADINEARGVVGCFGSVGASWHNLGSSVPILTYVTTPS